jgi:hypothetical protein
MISGMADLDERRIVSDLTEAAAPRPAREALQFEVA